MNLILLVMRYIMCLFLFFLSCSFELTAQRANHDTMRSILSDYNGKIRAGNLLGAVDCLTGLLESKIEFTAIEKLGLNNNLGVLHKNLGQYDIALKYYDTAESIFLNNNFTENSLLISIFGNKVNIYTFKGEYNKALDYIEKGIRSVKISNMTELLKQQSYSSFFLSAGIIYTQINNFDEALNSFKKSIFIKNKYNFSGKSNVYLNIAKIYSKSKNYLLADKYFKLSLIQSNTENNIFSALKVNILLEYGHFQISINENQKALSHIQEALHLSQKNSGEKNQLTANCYQVLGDYYKLAKKNYSEALSYYQKALISGSSDFNESSIEANPTPNDVFPNFWQLRVLSRKAEVLLNLALGEQNQASQVQFLSLCYNTINHAIEMTNSIRLEYQNEETRLDFTGKQKDIFVLGIETALKQYTLTGDKKFLNNAYKTSQQYKANELKYEIAKNRLFSSSQIPDSLRIQEIKFKNFIAGYNLLIQNEFSLFKPDTAKISYWKDQIFDLNRSLEKTTESIEKKYPQFIDKFKKGNIVPTEIIQANLKPDESLVDYVISEKDENGKRKIFEFIITKKDLFCHTEVIDSLLSNQFVNLKIKLINQFNETNNIENYNQLNYMLFNAYKALILPIRNHFSGNKLIIIPDEEISYFPFDALLTSWSKKKMINYAELQYLIFDYTFSYGYSTNTIWANQQVKTNCPKVIGFAPDYSATVSTEGEKYTTLKTNSNEIEKILTIFEGTLFKGEQASLGQFRSNLGHGSILHLAMHAEVNNKLSGSSSLLFTPDHNEPNNYRLYNYEIGQMNINSPMVVLSACNTGNGKLYSGEGAMSIARNFVLAGVPSVVETLWPVEDLAGSRIMIDFYKYLSEGKEKSTALRLAKLDYISSTPPSFVNPRYWASYTFLGDVTPIKRIWWKEEQNLFFSILFFLILIPPIIYYFLRSFRIK